MTYEKIRNRLFAALALVAIVLLLGTLGIRSLENLDILDSFYFCIITIATVGYGDIHPATQGGKLFSVLIIILGTGAFLGVIANFTDVALIEKRLKSNPLEVSIKAIDLPEFKNFLMDGRGFLVRTLGNTVLHEHESFSDPLMSLLHLTEELAQREDLSGLPEPDLAHLGKDTERAFNLLFRQWLLYMTHLRTEYPYIFSLAVRMNPFRKDRSALISETAR